MNRRVTRESEMLRRARIRLGYSQQKVATTIGMQIRQYQRFEYGETKIGRISFQAGLLLCTLLELDPVELVFGGNPEKLAGLVSKLSGQGGSDKDAPGR